MIKPISLCTALGLLTLTSATFAAGMDAAAASGSMVPQSGFFVGLGGSENSVSVDQNLYASGVSNVYLGNDLVAYGEAGGPATPFSQTESTFAPDGQLGYFQHFANSNWLWGMSFSYKYLGVTSEDDSVVVPQGGSFTNTGSAPADTTFTGNVVIGSAQMSVNHEFTLLPFIGHSFHNGFVYFGAGPALFGTRSDIYNTTGYADINGTHANITGAATNFGSSKWMFGGAAEVGMDYYFDPTWFLDFNYTFAITGWHTTYYSAPFASSTTSGGETYDDTGTLYANTSQRVIAQAVTVSINKVF